MRVKRIPQSRMVRMIAEKMSRIHISCALPSNHPHRRQLTIALLISLGSDVYLDISDLRCMYRHSEIAGIILSPQISGGPGAFDTRMSRLRPKAGPHHGSRSAQSGFASC